MVQGIQKILWIRSGLTKIQSHLYHSDILRHHCGILHLGLVIYILGFNTVLCNQNYLLRNGFKCDINCLTDHSNRECKFTLNQCTFSCPSRFCALFSHFFQKYAVKNWPQANTPFQLRFHGELSSGRTNAMLACVLFPGVTDFITGKFIFRIYQELWYEL